MPIVSTSDHKVKGASLNSHVAARSQVATVVNGDEVPSALLLCCLLFGLSSAIAAKGTAPPPLQAQPTANCNLPQLPTTQDSAVLATCKWFRVLQASTLPVCISHRQDIYI